MTKDQVQSLIINWRAEATDLRAKAKTAKERSVVHKLASIMMHQAHAQAHVYELCADQLELMAEK